MKEKIKVTEIYSVIEISGIEFSPIAINSVRNNYGIDIEITLKSIIEYT